MTDPLKVSAQFAAFVWYSNREAGNPDVENEAKCFAKTNWSRFLAIAHEGLGQLLLKIAEPGIHRADWLGASSGKSVATALKAGNRGSFNPRRPLSRPC